MTDEEFRVGLELEYPTLSTGREPLVDRAEPPKATRDLVRSVTDGNGRMPHGGVVTREHIGGPEHGIEARTPAGGLPVNEVADWYDKTIGFIQRELDEIFEPTSFYGDSTAGLHTHISPLGYDGAQRLYELSRQPFMWVFCGSAVAPGGSPVIRDNAEHYATFYDSWTPENSRHRAMVNAREAGRHYEWRLPEPMTVEHVELLCQFIDRFHRDFSDGENFARRIVEDGDDRLTSIARAKAGPFPDHSQPLNDAGELLAEVAL